MKKLQNNFTTPEQSKRLLELGVPADSADCSIDEWGRVHKIPQDNGNLSFSQLKRQTLYTIRPCWSVGRLIEIYVYLTSYEYVCLTFKKTFTPMDKILDKIEKDIANGMLDFSELHK